MKLGRERIDVAALTSRLQRRGSAAALTTEPLGALDPH